MWKLPGNEPHGSDGFVIQFGGIGRGSHHPGPGPLRPGPPRRRQHRLRQANDGSWVQVFKLFRTGWHRSSPGTDRVQTVQTAVASKRHEGSLPVNEF